MANICAVVLNSVSRDARVLKEAASLVEAGHEVTIVGIKDKNYPVSDETTNEGIRILRVDVSQVRTSMTSLLQAALLSVIGVMSILVALFPLSQRDFAVAIAIVSFASAVWFLHSFVRRLTLPSGMNAIVSPSKAAYRDLRGRFLSVGKTFWFWLRLWPLVTVARQMKPDVIHCHDIHTLPIGVFLRLRIKCILVYDAHEIYEEVAQADESEHRRCRRVHRLCQGFVDGFITINDSIAAWYAKSYPRLPRATVIMNASRMAGAVDYDHRLHRAAELPDEMTILLYQGGYSTHRGLELLVEGARYLPENWCLVMMGWGRFEHTLRVIADRVNQEALQYRGSAVVRFIPPAPQQELALWTAGATIGVIPYENTGLNHWFCTPNKLWEYPDAGVPVLVSPFPELRQPVEKYGYGWLLPEDLSPEGLGRVIGSLSSADIDEAKQNTARFVAENHWGIYEGRLLLLYEELCSRTGTGKSG